MVNQVKAGRGSILSSSFSCGGLRAVGFGLVLLFSVAVCACGFFGREEGARRLLESEGSFFTPTGESLRSSLLYGAAETSDQAGSGSSSPSPVEPDVYAFDEGAGRMYAANAYKGLVAFDVSVPESPALVGRVKTLGSPKELYLADGKVLLLLDPSSSYWYYDFYWRGSLGSDASKSSVLFVESATIGLQDGIEPRPLELGGPILDSRLVGDTLVVVTNEGYTQTSSASDSSSSSSLGYTYSATVRAIDLASGTVSGTFPVEGDCSAIFVAADAVFAAFRDGDWSAPTSTISRYDLGPGGLTPRGSVQIDGWISDRFKLDWDGSFLRVVAFDQGGGWSQRVTRVFAVDWRDADTPVSYEREEGGALELAPGESLYATRFDSDRCYVVTYLQVDPLFVVSFEDPRHPVTLGQCSPPGYSTHIEPVRGPSDERWLFAVGVDGAGQTKVAVFDATDPAAPSQLGTDLRFGNTWSYSPANWDWKRLNFLPELEAFAVPYYSYDGDRDEGGYAVALVRYGSSGPSLLCELPDSGDAERTIAAGADLVYTYAPDRLQSWRVTGSSPVRTAEVTIAENVVWASELGGYGIKIVQRDELYVVRSFEAGDYAGSGCLYELALPGSGSYGSYVYYPLDEAGLAALGDEGLLFLLAKRWSSSGSWSVGLRRIRVLPGGGLELDPGAIEVIETAEYLPISASGGGSRIVSAGAERVLLFHGDLTVVDAALWRKLGTVETTLGAAALASGDRAALFSWSRAGSPAGYGRLTLREYDLSDPASPDLLFETSFPGFPLYRSAEGLYVSAYVPDPSESETVLLSVRAGPDGAQVLGEGGIEGRLQSAALLEGCLAVLAGAGYYWLFEDSVGVAVAGSGAGRRPDGARGPGARAPRPSATSSSGLALLEVRPGASGPAIAQRASLEGWWGRIASSKDRLAVSTWAETALFSVSPLSIAFLRDVETGSSAGNLAFGGSLEDGAPPAGGARWLYVAMGFQGIGRFDAR